MSFFNLHFVADGAELGWRPLTNWHQFVFYSERFFCFLLFFCFPLHHNRGESQPFYWWTCVVVFYELCFYTWEVVSLPLREQQQGDIKFHQKHVCMSLCLHLTWIIHNLLGVSTWRAVSSQTEAALFLPVDVKMCFQFITSSARNKKWRNPLIWNGWQKKHHNIINHIIFKASNEAYSLLQRPLCHFAAARLLWMSSSINQYWNCIQY